MPQLSQLLADRRGFATESVSDLAAIAGPRYSRCWVVWYLLRLGAESGAVLRRFYPMEIHRMSFRTDRPSAEDAGVARAWVRHALLHLSDPSRLLRNPLTMALDTERPLSPAMQGKLIRERILLSMEALRPPAATPEASHAWRSYQLLHLRYVAELDVLAVCMKLAISKSEYHRDHRVALAAVGAALLAASHNGGAVVPPINQPSDDTIITRSSAAAAPGHTPYPLGRLIGRKAELAQLYRLLVRPSSGCRLLTVTGMPGVGKTRLALEVAVRLRRGYPGGVWVVSLGDEITPASAWQRVVEALGRDPLQCPSLAEGEALLVLDDCDADRDGCANLVTNLLCHHRGWRVLATSRGPLGVANERCLPLLPLAIPDPALVIETSALRRNPSVQLLLEHAVAAHPGFRLTRENAVTVAQLVRQLAGLPLAIELAAGRLRSSTIEELARDLADPLEILRNERRTGPSRHRSLSALFDGSYDALTLVQRDVFERLAVFDGGCTRETAAAVLTATGNPDSGLATNLAALVEQGLVLADTNDAETYFHLPSLLCYYAQRRLRQRISHEALSARHAVFFLAFAEAAERKLTGPEQASWLRRLERDLDNVRAALRSLLARGETEHGLRLASALWFFWHLRGRDAEGRDWVSRFLTLPAATAPPIWRAKALYAAAYLTVWRGDQAAARELAAESRHLYQHVDDQRGAAYATHVLALVARNEGDDMTERTYFQESVRLLEAVGDRWRAAWSLAHLAGTAFRAGDYATARMLHQQNLTTRLQLSDRHGVAASLIGLADVCCAKGDAATADTLYREALVINRDVGDREAVAHIRCAQGQMALQTGDTAVAEACFRESLLLRAQVGDRRRAAPVLFALAEVAEAQGHPARAVRLRASASALGLSTSDLAMTWATSSFR